MTHVAKRILSTRKLSFFHGRLITHFCYNYCTTDTRMEQERNAAGGDVTSFTHEDHDSDEGHNDATPLLRDEVRNPKSAFQKYKFQILATAVAATGTFNVGTVLGWTSPAIPSIMNDTNSDLSNLTPEEQGWVASIAPLGAVLAAFVAGFMIDKWGRKYTLNLLAAPFTIGWLILFFSKNIAMLLCGRFLTGFCAGAYTAAGPTFVGEVTDESIRGTFANALTVSIVSGILFVYLLGVILSWYYLTLVCALVPVLVFITTFFVIESPRYYVKVRKLEKARESIAFYNPYFRSSDVTEMLRKTEQTVMESTVQSVNFRAFFKKKVFKPLMISVALMFYQQLSGINAVIFNTVTIFKEAGSSIPDVYAAAIVAFVQLAMSILAAILVDRLGRRILLVASSAGAFIGLVALEVYFYEKSHHPEIVGAYGWIPLVSLLWYIIFYNIGLGPMPWLLMAELIPTNVKGMATSISTASNWFLAFIILYTFPTLSESYGMDVLLWTYAAVTFTGIFFNVLIVPETKGKSLEEIQAIFAD